MGALEQSANTILPIMSKIIGTLGLIIVFGSIFISVYKFKKKDNLLHMLGYLAVGILIYISSLLIDYIMHFDPFSEVKIQLPTSFFIGIILLVIFNVQKTVRLFQDRENRIIRKKEKIIS